MPDRSKALVSRNQLERVLARAAELQGSAADDGGVGDSLTEEQVEQLGKEVGLSPANIRQALAEERARIVTSDTGSGLAYQLFGGNRVGSQRKIRGTPARILETLDRWMQRDELLRVVRQRHDLRVWEPGRGLIDSLRRAFGSRDYALFRASEIMATVVAVDEQTSLVRVEADFSGLRSSAAKSSIFGAGLGTAATGAAIVMNVMLPVAIIPAIGVTALAYVGSRRRQQHALQRGLLAIEYLLDRLERGDQEPPSFIRMIESALPPR
ncbi:MAG TPA: hypothetical protein VEB19_17915 [Gemmatimonadaceae bacterium]|nr:hypothetical protein [Gemmatimonadaceae bacterium]